MPHHTLSGQVTVRGVSSRRVEPDASADTEHAARDKGRARGRPLRRTVAGLAVATDGDIGLVQGLVIDPGSRHVTHVLLQEGHLWGRKEVAIPISAVASTSDGIQLKVTKQEVQDLPPVDIDHPDGSTSTQEGSS
jgi:PRC-barrel domain protein